MGYHLFGRTGVKVSVLCLDCMMFGGKSEEFRGTVLNRNGNRHRVMLATKIVLHVYRW
jgi:aryl-alcohol dehydrogenase-like predicted oxidoreductase